MLTVVTGPPCSGKSAYVREAAEPGDVVVDFDTLAQALGSASTHDHPADIRVVAQDARRAAITAALAAHRRGARVWIVDTDPRMRQADYDAAGAAMVPLTAHPAELHRRADAAGRPALWHDLIERYTAVRPARPRASRQW